MGILSGLSSLGLGKLEGADIYAKEEAKPKVEEVKPVEKTVTERDLIFEKNYECPVCHKQFTESKVRSGKARLVKQDKDLRPIYSGIDCGKYDVISCPHCGYSALERWHGIIAAPQAKLVKENISKHFMKFTRHTVIPYEEAIERYKLTLANCIVKKGKDSEKAFTCLKMAWIIRGYAENYDRAADDYEEKIEDLKADEAELLHNALEGFISARQTESYPIAGMDSVTLDYLLSVLLLSEGKYDEAGRYVMQVLQSRDANARIKNKALDLKEEIIEKKKQQQ